MKIGRGAYLGVPAAVLAGLILFTYFSYRDDMAAAKARISSGSRVVDTPCGPIEYARLLDALKLPGAAILGGSAGAPSAIEFCLRHAGRCSAMVLLVPAFFPPGALQVRAQPSFMFESVLGSDFFFWLNMKVARDAMLERVFAIPVRDFENASAEEQERILRIARGILPLSRRRKGLWNDLAIVASSPRYELERIASPALVIGIEDDLFGIYPGSRLAAERIPEARFVSFPTGGHLWAGRQGEVALALTAFLNRSAAAKPARAR